MHVEIQFVKHDYGELTQVAQIVLSQFLQIFDIKYSPSLHEIQSPNISQVLQSLLHYKTQESIPSQVAHLELSHSKQDPLNKYIPSWHESHFPSARQLLHSILQFFKQFLGEPEQVAHKVLSQNKQA